MMDRGSVGLQDSPKSANFIMETEGPVGYNGTPKLKMPRNTLNGLKELYGILLHPIKA